MGLKSIFRRIIKKFTGHAPIGPISLNSKFREEVVSFQNLFDHTPYFIVNFPSIDVGTYGDFNL